MVKLGLEVRENEMIKRDGCGRRLSEITQCQGCGYSVFQVEYSLPEGWSEDSAGLWYCDECSPDYGPDDIGLRAPCDGYFVA